MSRPSSKQPPKLPTSSFNVEPLPANRHQRIRAGLIDHFIDSTVWVWLFFISTWVTLHLQTSIDARVFLILLWSKFSTSMSCIVIFFVSDFLLCIYRGQSLGQMINGICKVVQAKQPPQKNTQSLDILRLWLHGLVSRCLGLPLLFMCLLIILMFNPSICPIHLQDFSLIEPAGAYLLMVVLLKIIGITLLLFGFFLPAGLAFARGELPTWYDQLLGVRVIQKSTY